VRDGDRGGPPARIHEGAHAVRVEREGVEAGAVGQHDDRVRVARVGQAGRQCRVEIVGAEPEQQEDRVAVVEIKCAPTSERW
jgi:hypothetical protein